MKVLVIGAGTIGLPLGALLLAQGHRVTFTDNNPDKLEQLRERKLSLREEGVLTLIEKHGDKLSCCHVSFLNVSYDAVIFSASIGNQYEEALNLYQQYSAVCSNAKIILFRTTINKQQWDLLKGEIDLNRFCYIPERSRPGSILLEIKSYPQIVGYESKNALSLAFELFNGIVSECLETTVIEAIAIKLLSNSWRAATFNLANKYFLDCQKMGVSFEKISRMAKKNYPRLDSLPMNGFISGPCLEKDYQSWEAWKTGSINQIDVLNEELIQKLIGTFLTLYPKIHKRKIALLGKSYRIDWQDERNTHASKIRAVLEALGADVEIFGLNEKSKMIEWNADLVVNMFPQTEKLESIEQFDFWSL